MTKILIIDDDTDINNMLATLLANHGYDTASAYSGTEGLLLHGQDVNLILLDLMLPGKSGEEIIRSLKEKHPVPIIVISAIHEIDKKVDLFTLGADDYVTKPFYNEELLARIAARLRTDGSREQSDTVSYKDIFMDQTDYSASCNGQTLERVGR